MEVYPRVCRLLPVDSLWVCPVGINTAVDNICKGNLSETFGPLTVVTDDKRVFYQLVNGYHRLVQAVIEGKKELYAVIEVQETSTPFTNGVKLDLSKPMYGFEDIIPEMYLSMKMRQLKAAVL